MLNLHNAFSSGAYPVIIDYEHKLPQDMDVLWRAYATRDAIHLEWFEVIKWTPCGARITGSFFDLTRPEILSDRTTKFVNLFSGKQYASRDKVTAIEQLL